MLCESTKILSQCVANISKMEEEVKMAVELLNQQVAKLSEEWNAHPLKKQLVKHIRSKILPQENLVIDCALCLGLYSMEKCGSEDFWRPKSYCEETDESKDDSDTEDNMDFNLQNNFNGDGVSEDNDDADLEDIEDSDSAKDVEDAVQQLLNERGRDMTMFQLLIFETALKCLRMYSQNTSDKTFANITIQAGALQLIL